VYTVEITNNEGPSYQISVDEEKIFGNIYAPSPYYNRDGKIETGSKEPDLYSEGFTKQGDAVLFYDDAVKEQLGLPNLMVYTTTEENDAETQFFGELPGKYVSQPYENLFKVQIPISDMVDDWEGQTGFSFNIGDFQTENRKEWDYEGIFCALGRPQN
jgi:hypothetical protein